MDKRITLDEIFSPRGVAVVGASTSKIDFAEMVLYALKEAQFPAIYPVNPKYDEVLELPCYPDIQSIPGVVDHVIVNIPAESSLTLLDDCAAKGVKSVHFFTAGFGESGYSDRAELERAMLKKARAGGFRIIGPNCVGLYVPKSRLVNFFGICHNPGSIAFISQSGGHAINLPRFSNRRGLRFSKVVSYGNALDLDEIELLQYLAHDEETEIIAAYIEGVKDGVRFRKALGEAAARKPVIVYKGGRTDAGLRAAHGHTASMTSSVAVFDALCRQCNAILVESVDEIIDTLIALHFANPLPKGTSVAFIGAGGGPSVLAGDDMEKEGLSLPRFSEETQNELKKLLPVAGSIFTNPLDTPNLATPEAIAIALRVLSQVPEIDMLVYHIGFHPITSWGMGRFGSDAFLEPVIESMLETGERSDKPVILAIRPPADLVGMEEFFQCQDAFVRARLPVFNSLGMLARAMSRVVKWSQAR
jgi:acyl-CoA synthetase (NDP forming)